MMGVKKILNGFKANYSQARSRAALAKNQTTWQYPNNPSGYVYYSATGAVGPSAEFRDQFRAVQYKFHNDEIEIKRYEQEISNLIERGKKNNYTVHMTEDFEKTIVKDTGSDSKGLNDEFEPVRFDNKKLTQKLLETGLENGVFIIKDAEGNIVNVPKAPECKKNAEYMHYKKQEQMARNADFVSGHGNIINRNKIVNKIGKGFFTKKHEQLRDQVDMIQNGINPDIVEFNEKFGTNVDTRLTDYENLKNNQLYTQTQRILNNGMTPQQQAMAMLQGLNQNNLPDRQQLEQYIDALYNSGKYNNNQEQSQAQQGDSDKEQLPQEQSGSNEKNEDKKKQDMWDALILKMCQFIIDYRKDPVGTIDRFMAGYSNSFNDIKNDTNNVFHNDLNNVMQQPGTIAAEQLSDEISKQRHSSYYQKAVQYYQDMENHGETYQYFLNDESNKDLVFTDSKGNKIDLGDISGMNQEQMHSLSTLFDSGMLKMVKDGEEIEPLNSDRFRTEYEPKAICDYSERRSEVLNNLINSDKLTDEEKNTVMKIMEDNHAESVNEMNKEPVKLDSQNIVGALSESVFDERTDFQKKIDILLELQDKHYEAYDKIFDKAIDSDSEIVFATYDAKEKKLVPFEPYSFTDDFSEYNKTDRRAVVDLLENKRAVMFIDGQQVEKVRDSYTAGNWEKQFDGMSYNQIRNAVESRAIDRLNYQVNNNKELSDNVQQDIKEEIAYRKLVADTALQNNRGLYTGISTNNGLPITKDIKAYKQVEENEFATMKDKMLEEVKAAAKKEHEQPFQSRLQQQREEQAFMDYKVALTNHYKNYNSNLNNAVASGKEITVCRYNSQSNELEPIDFDVSNLNTIVKRKAFFDSLDNQSLVAYADNERLYLQDSINEDNNYMNGGCFTCGNYEGQSFKAEALNRDVEELRDKINVLDKNDATYLSDKKEIEQNILYKNRIQEYLQSGEGSVDFSAKLCEATVYGNKEDIAALKSMSADRFMEVENKLFDKHCVEKTQYEPENYIQVDESAYYDEMMKNYTGPVFEPGDAFGGVELQY